MVRKEEAKRWIVVIMILSVSIFILITNLSLNYQPRGWFSCDSIVQMRKLKFTDVVSSPQDHIGISSKTGLNSIIVRNLNF